MNEQDLAKRIVNRLDEGLTDLSSGTLYRLRVAREAALSRANAEQPGSGLAGGAWSGSGSAPLLNRRILVPLFGLILGLSVLLFWQQQSQQQISRQADYAELDAQVLTDELPVTAYLDTGFEVWLYHHTTD
jgi:uncharacterized protein HemX